MKMLIAVLVLLFALVGEGAAGAHGYYHHSHGGGGNSFWPSFALGALTGALYGPPVVYGYPYGYPPPVVYGYPPPPVVYGYPPPCNPHVYIRSGGGYCW